MARSNRERVVVHALGDSWQWALLDGRDRVVRTGRFAPGSPDFPERDAVTVLVDSSLCMGLKLDLPEMPAARLNKALRWAAEEHLAGSAENEHVAAGPRDARRHLCCVVIGEACMDELTRSLGGRATERMVPDALCLPWKDGEVSLAEVGGRILARWSDWSFGSFEPDLASGMLESVAPETARLHWYGGECPEWLEPRINQTVAEKMPLIAILARGAERAGINLLTGAWSSRSAMTARSHWRAAAVLAVGLGLMVVAVALVERHQLRAESERLQTEIEQRFARLFPDVGRVVRPREQAEREIARLRFGQAAGLLDLISRTAPVLQAQEQLTVDGLSYREGVLEVSLRAPDVAALEQLEQRLRALDLSAELQTASLDAEGVSGRIRIAGRPS